MAFVANSSKIFCFLSPRLTSNEKDNVFMRYKKKIFFRETSSKTLTIKKIDKVEPPQAFSLPV
jgi:hypothetical protein